MAGTQAAGGGAKGTPREVVSCKRCHWRHPKGKACPRCSDPRHEYDTPLKDDMREPSAKWLRRVGI